MANDLETKSVVFKAFLPAIATQVRGLFHIFLAVHGAWLFVYDDKLLSTTEMQSNPNSVVQNWNFSRWLVVCCDSFPSLGWLSSDG